MILKENGNGGGNYEPLSEGVHVAVCYGVVDLGTHHSEKFGNDQRQVLLLWEVPEERIQLERDGRAVDLPRGVSKRYTASLNEKANLRKMLVAWRGKEFTPEELAGFDLDKLAGKGCQVQIIHRTNAQGYARAVVEGVMGLPKGLRAPAPENPVLLFSLDSQEPIPGHMPEWIREVIYQSNEWKARIGGTPSPEPGGEDDSIPF